MSTSGYSGTPIFKKLGIKEGHKVCLINAPSGYAQYVDIPFVVTIIRGLEAESDLVHGFFHSLSELEEHYLDMYSAIHKKGMMWISWPKGSSKVKTDLNRDIIRNYVLERGLVDVKVASYNDIYSSLKFVFRLKDR